MAFCADAVSSSQTCALLYSGKHLKRSIVGRGILNLIFDCLSCDERNISDSWLFGNWFRITFDSSLQLHSIGDQMSCKITRVIMFYGGALNDRSCSPE